MWNRAWNCATALLTGVLCFAPCTKSAFSQLKEAVQRRTGVIKNEYAVTGWLHIFAFNYTHLVHNSYKIVKSVFLCISHAMSQWTLQTYSTSVDPAHGLLKKKKEKHK